jgi:NAD(P)-dependent dehydrogenase (short-subunit alcohol dehydrogenase family)
MDLNGKIALVTGGTKGIGAATAVLIASEGGDVAITGRHDDEEARNVAKTIRDMGRRCVMIVGDMGVAADCTRAVTETLETLGGLDVIFHNAGGGVPGGILEVEPDAWYQAFDVHVHAAYHILRAALPHMKSKGEGAIVMMSSVAGIQAGPGAITYGVVKGALQQFTRSLARELGELNIRVNAVAPGIIRTRFHEKMTPEQKKHNLDNRIPLHREGTPKDVAETVVFLMKNDFITGENIVVDGGMTMRIG